MDESTRAVGGALAHANNTQSRTISTYANSLGEMPTSSAIRHGRWTFIVSRISERCASCRERTSFSDEASQLMQHDLVPAEADSRLCAPRRQNGPDRNRFVIEQRLAGDLFQTREVLRDTASSG